jgi:regulation of enolase protein 1 (concanavalin A-like superfamily)
MKGAAMSTATLQQGLRSFRWLNEPRHWRLDSALEMSTEPDTDYWQRTHYGFRRDNGHFFYTNIEGDFTFSAAFESAPNAQYDQCGLMCRAGSETWIKCSTEYETSELSRLGSVVTNLGFSDWATQDIGGLPAMIRYKLDRRGDDFLISWSADRREWHQMRIAHLHECPARLEVGLYACSPTGPGFTCRVPEMTIGPNDWVLNESA